MNVWSKLVTALQGSVYEVGESIANGQALRIFDQEIRDADEELKKSKAALARIMAKHRLAQEQVGQTKAKISEYERYVLQALDKKDETLAIEIAEKIAQMETSLDTEQQQVAGLAQNQGSLRKAVHQAEGNLKRLKQQVDMVKATESVQKAQAAVAHRYSGCTSKMQTAMDSLDRIKQKQRLRAASMDAAQELLEEIPEDSLDVKLREAGITKATSDAKNVLERLKAKRKN